MSKFLNFKIAKNFEIEYGQFMSIIDILARLTNHGQLLWQKFTLELSQLSVVFEILLG